MLDVVTDAIHRLSSDQWWDTVHDMLDQMTPEEAAEYQAEARRLDAAAPDGLRAG